MKESANQETNLIEAIKKDIMNDDVSLATILRKAKILAFKLKSDEFRKWVDSELAGYQKEVEIPSYRKIMAQNFGIFSGPFRSRIDNLMIPTFNLPDSIKEFANEIKFPEGIKELESMADSDRPLQIKWPPEAIILARERINVSGGHVLVDAWQPISKQVICGILDAVRNRLLDFLLDLQSPEPRITESEELLSEVPNETVRKILNLTIYGDHNILAVGEDFIQNVQSEVKKNDFDSLIRYLRKLNITEEDLDDLKNAIESDGKSKNKQFGDKIKQWLGRMLVKASDGTWEISIQTAAVLLASALKSYMGW